ncbi:MAG: T9SS type A sorting domain-containing protein [Bacteroidetes bacterium]|nr:T9SS type A sorting domain-containing protein [Bacteroidota bacterium]
MKTRTLLFTTTLFIQLTAISQTSCLPEGITFTTQAQIDSFQVNYPGCTEIEGDVIINGDDISNLSGLNVITTVSGSLKIYGNNILTSLSGLENLVSIDSNLYIGNKILINRYGWWYGEGNPMLLNLEGLSNLNYIGKNILIIYNESLTSLTGLENVPSLLGNLEIICNNLLENLNGLNNINSIEGDLVIGGNNGLINLSGLENLETVNGNFSLHVRLGGWLYGYEVGNQSLLNLTGLNNLSYVNGGLTICNNNSLENLTGLENLTAINGPLWIGFWYGGNPSLNKLSGLDSLNSIGGNLSIIGNNVLIDLSGLDNLSSIGGYMEVVLNDNLLNLKGLESLTTLNGLGIHSNNSLLDFTGLKNLSTISGFFEIYSNNNLLNFLGLDKLVTIEGNIRIGEYYYGNPVLSSLSGLDNIDCGTIEYFGIIGNNNLSTCHIESICECLAVNNEIMHIFNNAPGCNNQQQVQDSCDSIQTGLPLRIIHDKFMILPNPLESSSIILYSLEHESHVSLVILDLSGRLVQTLVNENQQQGEQNILFNGSQLKPGIYFCTLKTNERIQTQKIIKR